MEPIGSNGEAAKLEQSSNKSCSNTSACETRSSNNDKEEAVLSDQESTDSKIDPKVLSNLNEALINIQHDCNCSNCTNQRSDISELLMDESNLVEKICSEVLMGMEINGKGMVDDFGYMSRDLLNAQDIAKHLMNDDEETENESESIQGEGQDDYCRHRDLISYYMDYSPSFDKLPIFKWKSEAWEHSSYYITALINLLLVLFSSKAFWNICLTVSNVLISVLIYLVLAVTTILVAIIMHFNEVRQPKKRTGASGLIHQPISMEDVELFLARRSPDIEEIRT